MAQKTINKSYESEELQDIRYLKIHTPKGYEKDSTTNYPLAIVLNGDRLFDLYVGNAGFYADTDNAPRQIVVGIDMKETRLKDASFVVETGELTENSIRFLNFLRNELIPYLDTNFKTSPFITIVGEGVSANLITYFLKDKEPIINSYILINAVLPDNISQRIVSYNMQRYAKMDNTFYMYLSGNTLMQAVNQSNVIAFGDFLKNLKIKTINVTTNTFENPISALAATGMAIPNAFAKSFEIYSGITKDEYETKIKNLSPPDAINYVQTKYLDIEFLFGSNVGIREQDIFAIENIIIEKENGKYLKEFGDMILKLYPSSHMGNYYLGRYFETGGDNKSALRQYRLGYGKMDPSDANADKFYENVLRVLRKR